MVFKLLLNNLIIKYNIERISLVSLKEKTLV